MAGQRATVPVMRSRRRDGMDRTVNALRPQWKLVSRVLSRSRIGHFSSSQSPHAKLTLAGTGTSALGTERSRRSGSGRLWPRAGEPVPVDPEAQPGGFEFDIVLPGCEMHSTGMCRSVRRASASHAVVSAPGSRTCNATLRGGRRNVRRQLPAPAVCPVAGSIHSRSSAPDMTVPSGTNARYEDLR